TPESHPALLFEYSDPGTAVPLETFNAWYDAEHMPAQAAIAGFHTGVRAAAHFQAPPPPPTSSPCCPRMKRRVYTLAASRTHPAVQPPHEFLYVVSADIRPDAADAFHVRHDGEQTDAFSAPHAEHGAAAQRGEARPLKYLVIHEWTNAGYVALVAALHLSEMAQAILGLEIRVFELYQKE
ncbi:hypothetical protein B0H10DRAFT_2007215, partial [Mycena sp. CBHHK59/15]